MANEITSEITYLDSAATTKCCDAAFQALQQFSTEVYGNPSSSHSLGRGAALAIQNAREFFAKTFGVEPDQVIFTGSGTESDNLAITGCALSTYLETQAPTLVLCSPFEHPAVKSAVTALRAFGIQGETFNPHEEFTPPLSPALVSVHQVNNVTGEIFDVEKIAQHFKARSSQTLFHTDAVQAFGRISIPHKGRKGSAIDLVSLSAHKIEGPKGVGALIVLNRKLLQSGLRPLIWGGQQEGGFRSGTQNAGLIAAFHKAAELTLAKQTQYHEHALQLRNAFIELVKKGPLASKIVWNSPLENSGASVAHILHFSVPGFPAGAIARLLEESGFLISTGSACGSHKVEPDPVLKAMGLPPAVQTSGLRVSLSDKITLPQVEAFYSALKNTLERLSLLKVTR